MSRSPAYAHLRYLRPGDQVPAGLYVLDHKDGERPRWTVREVQDLVSVRRLVLVDPGNGADDLFDDGQRVALTVLTCPRFTRRTGPYMLGGGEPDLMCDMDQQARAVAHA